MTGHTLTQVGNPIYQFTDSTRTPAYTYAGVEYPEAPISYFVQGNIVYDLWTDGYEDVFIPLMRGYASGIDTRLAPLVFKNNNGQFTEASSEVVGGIPAIPGVRRIAEFGKENDPYSGLFMVQHDTGDGQGGDAVMLSAGATVNNQTANAFNNLPAALDYGRYNAVNAHSMDAGDINGDGRTDFIVGDWGDWNNPNGEKGAYFLIQNADGQWNTVKSDFLNDITFNQPLEQPQSAGENQNLLIDLHLDDFNGDGFDDIISGWGHGSTASYLYLNSGDGSFSVENSVRLPDPLFGISNSLHLKTFSPDIDNDGFKDIVVIQSKYEPYYSGYDFQFLINNGDGTFRDETSLRWKPIFDTTSDDKRLTWSDNFEFIDVNGDGALDIIGSDFNSEAGVRVLINDGNGIFNEIPINFNESLGFTSTGWRDFDKDGKLETLAVQTGWTDTQGSAVEVFVTQFELDSLANTSQALTIHDTGQLSQIIGKNTNDKLYSASNNAFISGNGGNDFIDGGAGNDTAVFRGNRSEYQLLETGKYLVVSDSKTTRDGTDTLYDVEAVQFVDGIFSISDLIAPDSIESAVYRFFNSDTGTHFYSNSLDERNNVINNLDSFNFEGTSFKAVEATAQNAVGIHRFYNNETGTHFYTASEAERDQVQNNLPQFNYEGVSYYGYGVETAGSQGLHRFFNTETGVHFYTASDAEQAQVASTLSNMTYEGISYWVDTV